MKDKILFSVVIPLYNKETSIENTILSVISQTYTNLEIIIVNDGSTDESIEKVKKIKDKRIKIFNKKNEGVSKARNYGVNKSNGEYIFFIDADDTIYSNCIERFYDSIRKYVYGKIFISNYYYVSKLGVKNITCLYREGYIDNPLKLFYEESISCRTGNMVFEKNIFKNFNFNEKISIHEDTDMWVRILPKFKCVYIPEVLHEYNKHFSVLSESRINITNEFAYYVKLNKKTGYEKKILANNILRSIIRRIYLKDYKAAFFLLCKNLFYIHTLIYIYAIKKVKTWYI